MQINAQMRVLRYSHKISWIIR